MDDGEVSCEDIHVPIHLNAIALPTDPQLRVVHNLYRTSKETRTLKSERDRTIFPEEFIENPNLGTLKDLCVRAIAHIYPKKPLKIVQNNRQQLQRYYESLDVNLPLKEAYKIDNDIYWRRVVLAKTNDLTLILKKDYEWKCEGVSKKFVEILEACPAEYWPKQEMTELALMIKDFVKTLHIKRLKSLGQYAFAKHFEIDRSSSISDDDEEEDIISPLDETPIETSEENETQMEDIQESYIEKTQSQFELEALQAEEKAQRKEQRRQLREIREKEKERRRQKRERRENKRLKRLALEEAKLAKLKKKKKKKMKQPKNFFNIQLSESEDDEENKICDRRNKELLLASIKMYTYPPRDCHHIDLSIVQYFTNMHTLWIEFLGPVLQRAYHYRHLNFSYKDMKNLATGIQNLRTLQVFRLRRSRMDSMKLDILIDALKDLPSLKVLDFGIDDLEDDCVTQWKKLFSSTKTVCNLELESNFLDIQTMAALGEALKNYTKGTLEYLGLARNPISDSALHALVSNIVHTNQVKCINLSGMINLTEVGISCCIANELVRQHSPLIYLDMTAVYTSSRAADEIVKALDINKKILGFKVHACSLDKETECDIHVLINRNNYIHENPFVGDITVPNEKIDEWLYRTKNPIMLAVLKERQHQINCMKKYVDFSEGLVSKASPRPKKLLEGRNRLSGVSTTSHVSDTLSNAKLRKNKRFVYKSNNFSEKEFLEYLHEGGHKQRYPLFKAKRVPVSTK